MEIKIKGLYERLEDLEQETSYSGKEAILIAMLQEVKNAEPFLRLTYNDTVYGIKEKTIWNAYQDLETLNPNQWESVSDWLAVSTPHESDFYEDKKIPDLIKFSKEISEVSGNEQIIKLRKFLDTTHPLKRKWFARALLHDLRAGIKVKTVNKVFKQLGLKEIEKFSLQLCNKIDVYDEDAVKKKITFPCSMECKYDGIRIQAEVHDGKCWLTSRRGTDRTEDFPDIVEDLIKYFGSQHVIFDGEVIAGSFQKLMNKEDKSTRKYVIFDLLLDEKLPYRSRWDNLFTLLNNVDITDFNEKQINNINSPNNTSVLRIAEHYTANNIKDLQEYYEELNKRGEEGIIIKLDSNPYERGSRKNMFKCKKVFTADLMIVGYKLGEGKRAGKVATLCLTDAKEKINVDVGSGIDDDMCGLLTSQIHEEAEGHTQAEFVGKICEIKYNELTETGSIRFPRFVCIREDKTEADDLCQNS